MTKRSSQCCGVSKKSEAQGGHGLSGISGLCFSTAKATERRDNWDSLLLAAQMEKVTLISSVVAISPLED